MWLLSIEKLSGWSNPGWLTPVYSHSLLSLICSNTSHPLPKLRHIKTEINMQIEREKQQHWHHCCTYSKSHWVLILTAVEMQITHAGDNICTAAAPLQLPERTAVLQIHYKCLLCILHSRKYFYTAECPARIHVYLQGGSLFIAARLLAYFHVTLYSFLGVL